MSWRDREPTVGGLRTEPRQDYQVMIDYIKDQIGEGREYVNDLVRVVLSDRGCYYEFRDMPEEFSGAVGSGFRYEFVGTEQGLLLANTIQHMALGPASAAPHT